MSRFRIRWSPDEERWLVWNSDPLFSRRPGQVEARFPTLHEAETYVIERQTRSES